MIHSIADVLEGVSIGLATALVPPALALLLAGRRRTVDAGEFLPLVLVSAAGFFLAAGVLGRVLVPSIWIYIAAGGLAFAACIATEGGVGKQGVGHSAVSWSYVALAAGFALVAVVDCVWIFSAQSWGLDARSPHVVSPMQLDPQRNTNMVTALARGNNTLFLPEGVLLYQVLWYRGAAAMMSVLPDSPTRYYQVGGMVVALGWVLYFSLVSIVLETVGRKRTSLVSLVLLGAVVLLDGRVDDSPPFAYLQRLVMWGQEAPLFFQYFSVKLLALTAPQHALFLTLFFGAVYVRLSKPESKVLRAIPLWGVLMAAAFVASPVLAAFVMPSYVVADALVQRLEECSKVVPRFVAMGVVLAVAAGLHWVVIGYPPQDLFGRTEAVTLKTFWGDGFQIPLRLAVLAPLQCAGVLGLVFLVLLVPWFRFVRNGAVAWVRGWIDTGIAVTALVFISWNVVITDTELRRHGSMVLVVGMSLTGGAILLMLAESVNWLRNLKIALAAFVMAFFLNLRFVHSYTAEARTVVAQDIAWKDYFEANRYLRSTRPKGVISASGEGLVLPIANEAATALVPKLAVLAHQRVSGAGAALMQATTRMSGIEIGDINQEWVSLAREAGFDTIVWGPVEELHWGYFGRRILLDRADFLGQFGEVGIYRFPPKMSGRGALQPHGLSSAAAKSVCTAYIRSVLRRSGVKVVSVPQGYEVREGRLGAIQAGSRLDRNLGASDGEPRCAPELLLATAPVEAPEALTRTRMPLDASMPVQQSSRGVGLGKSGPESLLDARPTDNTSGSAARHALTGWEREPWWQIDLGRDVELSALQVDRVEGPPPYGVQHLTVMISDRPFPSRPVDPFKPGSMSYFIDGDWPRNKPIATPGARGRYLRVQLAGYGNLSLGGVRIWSATR